MVLLAELTSRKYFTLGHVDILCTFELVLRKGFVSQVLMIEQVHSSESRDHAGCKEKTQKEESA